MKRAAIIAALFGIASTGRAVVSAVSASEISDVKLKIRSARMLWKYVGDPSAQRFVDENWAILTFSVRTPSGFHYQVYSLDKVVLSDGLVATSQGSIRITDLESKPISGEWQGGVILDPVPAGIRRINRITGEVILFRQVRVINAAVPLPASSASLPPNPVPEIRVKAIHRTPNTLTICFDLARPQDSEVITPTGFGWPNLTVKMRSGETIEAQRLNVHEPQQESGWHHFAARAYFYGDEPASVTWRYGFRQDSTLRFPFDVRNIPLDRRNPLAKPAIPPQLHDIWD